MDRPAGTLGAVLVLTIFAVACGGESNGSPCDENVAPVTTAATITVGSDVSSYGALIWGANNDCTPTGSTVVSITIRGEQTQPPDLAAGLGLCLPRPDRITDAPINLADATLVELVGATATAGGCVTTIAPGATPTGTVTFKGFCTRPDRSYLVTLAGQVAGTKTCGASAPTAVTMALGGTTTVHAQQD